MQNFIQTFNTYATNTVKNTNEFSREENIVIDYTNCVSLKEVMDTFNKLYLDFMADYATMPKLNYAFYENFVSFEENTLFMALYNVKGIIDKDEYKNFIIEEKDGSIEAYLFNQDKSYNKKVDDISKYVLRGYYNLAKKHEVFLKTCEHFFNKLIFCRGNGINSSLSIKLVGNPFLFCNKLNISFGNIDYTNGAWIDATYDLGPNYKLENINVMEGYYDTDKTQAETLDYLLEHCYISNERLPEISNYILDEKCAKRKLN